MKSKILLIPVFFFCLGVGSAAPLENIFYLTQKGSKIHGDGTFFISSEAFEIHIKENLTKGDIPLRLFVFENDSQFQTKTPVSIEETTMFASGTGLAKERDEVNVELYVNKEYTHNHYTGENYRFQNNETILSVAKISCINTKKQPQKLYVTMFVDFDKNKIMDKDEVVNFKLNISLDEFSPLLDDMKYVSASEDQSYVTKTTVKKNQFFDGGKSDTSFENQATYTYSQYELEISSPNLLVPGFCPYPESIDLTSSLSAFFNVIASPKRTYSYRDSCQYSDCFTGKKDCFIFS